MQAKLWQRFDARSSRGLSMMQFRRNSSTGLRSWSLFAALNVLGYERQLPTYMNDRDTEAAGELHTIRLAVCVRRRSQQNANSRHHCCADPGTK